MIIRGAVAVAANAAAAAAECSLGSLD